MHSRRAMLCLVSLWLSFACLTGLPASQSETSQSATNPAHSARVRRLILKDGSFEPVIQYEVKGDRVRYLSADRHEWEELPGSIVDWPATEKYAEEAAAEALTHSAGAAAGKLDAEEAASPLVSTGIRLPASGGVFLLDVFHSNPELIKLSQNGADVNRNTAGNILRATINPIAGPRQTIELKGAHAAAQAHVPTPSIFVAVDLDTDPSAGYTPENAKDHFRIVRCEEKKGNRVVGVINIAVYGKVKQDAKYVETKVDAVSGPWVRVTPAAALQPGEYALVELLGKEGMNQFVWDFGVNPGAPQNTGVIQAEPARKAPVLLKKPKEP